MTGDEERRVEGDARELAGPKESRGSEEANKKDANAGTDHWGDAGTDDPAFYLKPATD